MNKHECKNCKYFIESSIRGLCYGYCSIRILPEDCRLQVLKDYYCSMFEESINTAQEVRSEYRRGYEEGYAQGYIDGSTGADWKGEEE